MVDMVNPYIAGAPVTEKRMFFGRDDVFQWITNSLSGQYADHILVIHGQRRVGKTSVLKQLGNRLPARYTPVFFDLQGRTHTTFDRFLWWLAREIARVLKQEKNVDIPVPEKEEFSRDFEIFDNRFLGDVYSVLPGQTLLLTFDEFDNLEETEVKDDLARPLVDYLKQMMGREGLNFIFSIGSSGRKLENMQAAYTDFFKSALYKKISFLSEEQAHKLITEPVAGVIEYDHSAVESIYTITSGHPYFTQLVCHELFSRCQRNEQHIISRQDVGSILEDVVERGTVNLKFVWDEASDLEKWSLAALAQMEKSDIRSLEEHLRKNRVRFSENDLNSSLLRLREKDVLTRDNRFVIYLLKLWLQKNRPMDQVREELTEVNPIANRYIEIGLEFKDSGQYAKAIESFQEALAVARENVQAQVSIGLVYMDQKSYEKAIIEFEKALGMDDEDVSAISGLCEAHLALGDAAFARDRTKEAMQSYQRVLAINSEHTEARQRMAELTSQRAEKALQEGRDEESLALFLEALNYSPEDRVIKDRLDQVREETKEKILSRLKSRVTKELAAKNWEMALKSLEEASRLAPDDKSIREKLLEIRQKQGEEHTNGELSRADSAARNKQWEEAEAILTSLLAAQPDGKIQAQLDELRIQKQAARVAEIKTQAASLTRLEKYDEAISAWEEYLHLAPENRVEAEQAIQIIRSISSLSHDYADAQEAIRRKHYGRAIELLQGIIARDPMYKSTSRLLAEAVQANRATPLLKRGWVRGVLGILVLGLVVTLGVLFGPPLWRSMKLLLPTAQPAGTSSSLPSLDEILAYMSGNQDFFEDFSGSANESALILDNYLNPDFVVNGNLILPLKVGSPTEKLSFSVPGRETTNFAMEFDYFFETNSGVSLVGMGFPEVGTGDKNNVDAYIEWDTANLAQFSWFAGLSDRSIDHRGSFDPDFQGKWHTLQVLYYCSRLVVYNDEEVLQEIDGIGRSTKTSWIVAATNTEATIRVDNIHYWDLDAYISCPASSAPSTATAGSSSLPTQEARILNPANGHYYLHYDTGRLWQDAKKYCVEQGGHLVTIEDEAENTFVWQLQPNPGLMWLGATDEDIEGFWVWANGEPFQYGYWSDGEPNDANEGEDYLAYSRFDSMNWYDVNDMELDFVCEWEPVVDTNLSATIQSYINVQPPTFEDDFSQPDMVWGGTNEGLAIYALVADGFLRIAPSGGEDPESVRSVLFPVNGLLNASDFALRVLFKFNGLSKFGLQFKSTSTMNTGYRFVFTYDSWDLYYFDSWITGGGWTLSTDFQEALLIVKGESVALYMNDALIYEGNDFSFSGTGNYIFGFGKQGSPGLLDDIKFWNLDGVEIESLPSPSNSSSNLLYETIQSYMSQESPTFQDFFSIPKPDWGLNSEGINVTDTYSYNGQLHIRENIKKNITSYPDYSQPGLSFPMNGLLDASDFAIQFDFELGTLDTIGLQFRSAENANNGYFFGFDKVNFWSLKSTWDGKVIASDRYEGGLRSYTLLVIVKGTDLLITINGNVIYQGIIVSGSGKSNRIFILGTEDLQDGIMDNFKFWNLDGVEISGQASIATVAAPSLSEPILTYIANQPSTFEDNFEPIKAGWGNNSETFALYGLVENGHLRITDNIQPDWPDDFGGTEFRVPGVSFPINGLFDASNFALQFTVQFDTLGQVGIHFRTNSILKTGYRFTVFPSGKWKILDYPNENVVSEGAKSLFTLDNKVLIIVNGDYAAVFLNNTLIYEGNGFNTPANSNRIILYGGNNNDDSGSFDNFKFWNLDGVDFP